MAIEMRRVTPMVSTKIRGSTVQVIRDSEHFYVEPSLIYGSA